LYVKQFCYLGSISKAAVAGWQLQERNFRQNWYKADLKKYWRFGVAICKSIGLLEV